MEKGISDSTPRKLDHPPSPIQLPRRAELVYVITSKWHSRNQIVFRQFDGDTVSKNGANIPLDLLPKIKQAVDAALKHVTYFYNNCVFQYLYPYEHSKYILFA